MRAAALGLILGATAVPLIGVGTAPVAGAYSNCSEARAAGAAPLYAGQPGYSRKLDRDGDGVACETGGGSAATGSLPLLGVPNVPAAPAPVAPTPAVPPAAPAPTGTGAAITTVVQWTGTDCIDITAPAGSAGTLQTATHCGGQATLTSSGSGDQMVGADPIIGDAGTLSCEILSGRLVNAGTAGDGHDVNCLTRADALS